MSQVPVATHVEESSVLPAAIEDVWTTLLNPLDFSWWQLVQASQLKHGDSFTSVGAVMTLQFKDGVSWDIQIQEISNLRHFFTFEVISCEPASFVTSAIHTIALKKVTANNATFIEWVSDFSNDATAEIISDSRFKRLEAFSNLASRFTA